jgi:hypothetical protein
MWLVDFEFYWYSTTCNLYNVNTSPSTQVSSFPKLLSESLQVSPSPFHPSSTDPFTAWILAFIRNNPASMPLSLPISLHAKILSDPIVKMTENQTNVSHQHFRRWQDRTTASCSFRAQSKKELDHVSAQFRPLISPNAHRF